MEATIPEHWIKTVMQILDTGGIDREIQVTVRARQNWEETTNLWGFDLVDAIKSALTSRGTGKFIEAMHGDGETYAFWIFNKKQKLYAKLCLLKGRVSVRIISAHLPNNGDAL